MKDLAEQAATGTYDSTQRLMSESEYQQMAAVAMLSQANIMPQMALQLIG